LKVPSFLPLPLFCIGGWATRGGCWPSCFLAPDLSFFAYLAGARVGAFIYNLLHTIAGPILLALAALLVPYEPAMAIALIWLAHCGFDRALGYGLKYDAGFGFTHLGRIGRAA